MHSLKSEIDGPASLASKDAVKKLPRLILRMGLFIALLAFILGGTFFWYSLNNPCDAKAVQKTSAMLMIQMRRYDDVYMVTTGASPTLVLLPVSALQQIYMDTQQIPVPACMKTAKDELLGYMRGGIRAFEAYAAGEKDAIIIDLLDESYGHVQVFFRELEKVKTCAPLCPPW